MSSCRGAVLRETIGRPHRCVPLGCSGRHEPGSRRLSRTSDRLARLEDPARQRCRGPIGGPAITEQPELELRGLFTDDDDAARRAEPLAEKACRDPSPAQLADCVRRHGHQGGREPCRPGTPTASPGRRIERIRPGESAANPLSAPVLAYALAFAGRPPSTSDRGLLRPVPDMASSDGGRLASQRSTDPVTLAISDGRPPRGARE